MWSAGKSSMLFLLLRTSALLSVTCVATLHGAPVQSDTQAMIYLAQFGYLSPQVKNPSAGTLITTDAMKKAIVEFQAFAGLNITGELDRETAETMSLPRCGVRDKVGYATDSRSKRYALQGSRWRTKDLKYKISKYPSTKKLSRSDVDKEVAKAFQVWSDYTDLKFTPTSGQVHIEIRFERGEHGDGDPFDGPGGTLAHAYFPIYGGDAHFDDAESWSINSYRGTNLFQVAAHEFGHSLGLSHSDVKQALMAPFYRGYEPHFELDIDDIQGIQALYGKKARKTSGESSPKTTTSTETPSGEADAELCNDATIDTAFNSAEGATYVLKGNHYWKLTEEGIAEGYPKLISKTWPGLPGSVDAAFTYRNGKTYFFKGDKYWRYKGKTVDGDYPKPISEGFTGIPDNIDAAFVWSGNGKIYFFKGSKFWRFDPSQRPPVKSTYPKFVSNWEGIPDNIDAALQYTNGYTYFFKRGQYYRFNDRSFSVDTADPTFPRAAGYWWFGCKAESSGSSGNKGWFLSGSSYPGLSGTEVGDTARRSSRGDDADSSDVDDLILDAADAKSQPRDENGRSSDRTSGGSTTAHAHMLVTGMATLLLLAWSRSS